VDEGFSKKRGYNVQKTAKRRKGSLVRRKLRRGKKRDGPNRQGEKKKNNNSQEGKNGSNHRAGNAGGKKRNWVGKIRRAKTHHRTRA